MRGVDARPNVRRRSLVTGAAWAVPVVAVASAAPALAASNCTPTTQTLNWDEGTLTKTDDYHASWTSNNVPGLVLTMTTVSYGTNTANPSNYGVVDPVGGLNEPGLQLFGGTSLGVGNRNEYIFSFNQPVDGLTLTLTDIDAYGKEATAITPRPATYQQYSTITGTGLLGTSNQTSDPWIQTGPNVNNTTGNEGNVSMQYTSPITSFTVANWGSWTTTTANTSLIYLAGMTIQAC